MPLAQSTEGAILQVTNGGGGMPAFGGTLSGRRNRKRRRLRRPGNHRRRIAPRPPGPRYPERVKRFHVTTFGCQMNVHDSERMRGMLTSLGYEEAEERGEPI